MPKLTPIIPWLLTASTIAIGLAFAALNNQEVGLNAYWHTFSLSTGFLVPLSMLIGALLAYLTMLPYWIKHYTTLRALRKALRRAEQEIAHRKVSITE